MGYGDFKLFAALGAWFGWQALVPIILMASVIGALIGIAMKMMRAARRRRGALRPFLALAGLTA
jgi:leader peptidase (prepilin peptidase)/N-methyltransferase